MSEKSIISPIWSIWAMRIMKRPVNWKDCIIMRAFAIATLILIATASESFAEVLSPSAQPGAVIQYNMKPWAIPQKDSSTPEWNNQTPKGTQEKDDSVQLAPKEAETIIEESKLRILIKDIRVEGASLISGQAIEKIIAPFRNQSLTFKQMQEIADKLTQLYIQHGYVTSQVYIPPQDFANQTLILKALEAKVGSVVFEKSRWFSERAVMPRLDLKENDNLNINALSRRIQLVNDNPDLKVRIKLSHGEMPGTSNVQVQASDHFPVHVTPFWDNLGRNVIGTSRFGLTATHNNLLGLGDIETNAVNFTKRSFGVVNQYQIPINSHGTQLAFDYAYSNLRPGQQLKPLEIRSSAQIYSPSIRQNLWKTDRLTLNSELAFDFKNIDTNLLGSPLYRDRLRVLRPSLSGYMNDRWGHTNFFQEFGIGLNILGGATGSTALASKPGSGTKFFRMTGGLTRVQKLPFRTTGLLRARYQYTPDRLVSMEQFQVGGAYTVRGYREGLIIGDKGYNVNAEWYVPLPTLSLERGLPGIRKPLQTHVHLVSFVDMGQAFTSKPLSGEMRQTTLIGCGAGLRVQLTRFLVGRVDLGIPLTLQSGMQHVPRLHFGLQSTLF